MAEKVNRLGNSPERRSVHMAIARTSVSAMIITVSIILPLPEIRFSKHRSGQGTDNPERNGYQQHCILNHGGTVFLFHEPSMAFSMALSWSFYQNSVFKEGWKRVLQSWLARQ